MEKAIMRLMPVGWKHSRKLGYKDWALVNSEEEGCTTSKIILYFNKHILRSPAFNGNIRDVFPVRE